MDEIESVVFQEHPAVEFASNIFVAVPVILQFEETPLLEVVRVAQAGYTASYPVFHGDGTYLAKVVGSQIYLTAAGKAAKITQRHEPGLTACELEGKTILELRRTGAAALRGQAELYAPEGFLVSSKSASETQQDALARGIRYITSSMHNNAFWGCPIGIHVTRDAIGFGGRVTLPPPQP